MQQVADVIAEGKRLMGICNACRYCEGYCAVFHAMERRLTFTDADMDYLANLCHNCAECYFACQYAPPHEFAVNVPKVFAEIRARSYQKNAWPRFRPVSATSAVVVGIIIAATLAGRRAATAGCSSRQRETATRVTSCRSSIRTTTKLTSMARPAAFTSKAFRW